jgi:hypothetical protein
MTRVALSASKLGAMLGAMLLLAVVMPDAPARACGGLFCDRPPVNPLDPLPVAQAGENVVFGIEGDPANGDAVVTAHIQILYSGAADQFSWVVPVSAVPQLSTGTDRLFSALGVPTQPSFQGLYQIDGTCIPDTRQIADAGTASGRGGSSGSGGVGGGVAVVFQGAVGPYDASILQSSSADELKGWLNGNGYYVDPRAGQIIDAYVAEGKYFVALKLRNGQDVRSIRPIVLTFHGTEPCVPLRLTAIAALPDMPVTVYVLGHARAVPLGFLELKLDDLRIDWLSGGANYAALLREAANEAGGNAFVTEFAGPATIAAQTLWTPTQFDVAALRAAPTPPVYVQQLVAQGLANDTQTLPLLQKYIPMPAEAIAQGITPRTFYGNLATYWVQFAFPQFDLAALTDAVVSDIVEPRRLAQQMIDGQPYLTRLGTFISPEEMNSDPLFAFNADLPGYQNVHTANLRVMCGNQEFMFCNAPMRLELNDGRMAWLRGGVPGTTCRPADADTSLDKLPATEMVWERRLSGEGTRRIDNTSAIQTSLAMHNAAFVRENDRFPIPGGGGGDRAGGPTGLGGAIGGPGISTRGGSGCGCAFGPKDASAPLALLELALVVAAGALVRGRRRRRR